jgi:chromosome segregation ATPase
LKFTPEIVTLLNEYRGKKIRVVIEDLKDKLLDKKKIDDKFLSHINHIKRRIDDLWCQINDWEDEIASLKEESRGLEKELAEARSIIKEDEWHSTAEDTLALLKKTRYKTIEQILKELPPYLLVDATQFHKMTDFLKK